MRTALGLWVLLGLACCSGALAQSRLQRLEAAGASSALDRFEFGRQQRPTPPRPIFRPVAPRPILDRLPRARPAPEPEEDSTPVARRKPKTVRPAVAAAETAKPAPPPDLWASRVDTTAGWGPLDLD